MNPVLHLLGTMLVCTVLVRPLTGARWLWRAPRTGILLWQLLAVAWVLSVVGTLVALALLPNDPGVPAAVGRLLDALAEQGLPAGLDALGLLALAAAAAMTAGLLGAFGWQLATVLRTRRRHRDLLALVARRDPAAPGALVLDHPLAMAYCLPGWRSTVVLSSGALDALDGAELAAVLAHERSHAHERHDLVLLPFATLRRAMPAGGLLRSVHEAVALLVEMRADDTACRHGLTGSLAMALRHFSATGSHAPSGTLGAGHGGDAVRARLERIDSGTRPLPWPLRSLTLLAGLVLVSTPLVFLTQSF